MGTGMLKQATGLPISGESLRRDFASAPTSFGMQLEHNALSFYEENCVGCQHRIPTDAAEHLGMWSEARISDRKRRWQREDATRKAITEARRRRREDRRLLLGAPHPTVQSILDLIDRVDSEELDTGAEGLLISHAEMSPEDFPDAVLEHMVTEAIAIGIGALVDSVIAVFERDGRPLRSRGSAEARASIERTPRRGQVLAIDEAHRFLNRDAGRTQRILFNKLADFVLLFTATPVNRGPRDLVAIVDLLEADNFDDEVLDVLGRLLRRRADVDEAMSASERGILQRAIQRFTLRRRKTQLNALIDREPDAYRDAEGEPLPIPRSTRLSCICAVRRTRTARWLGQSRSPRANSRDWRCCRTTSRSPTLSGLISYGAVRPSRTTSNGAWLARAAWPAITCSPHCARHGLHCWNTCVERLLPARGSTCTPPSRRKQATCWADLPGGGRL